MAVSSGRSLSIQAITMPAPQPPSPESSEEEETDENLIVRTPKRSLGAVRSTPERHAIVRAIVPQLGLDRLRIPSTPPRAAMEYTAVGESMAWPSIFADVKSSKPPKPSAQAPQMALQMASNLQPLKSNEQLPQPQSFQMNRPSHKADSAHPLAGASSAATAASSNSSLLNESNVAYVSSNNFQRQLQVAEREAKRKGGVDTLDFLTKLELVEALDVVPGFTPLDTSGSAPPHYKGSPLQKSSPLRSRAAPGFIDDTFLQTKSGQESSLNPTGKSKKGKKSGEKKRGQKGLSLQKAP